MESMGGGGGPYIPGGRAPIMGGGTTLGGGGANTGGGGGGGGAGLGMAIPSISSSCFRAISINSLADLAPSLLPVETIGTAPGGAATAAVAIAGVGSVGTTGRVDAGGSAEAFRRRGSCGLASSTTSSSLVGVPGDRVATGVPLASVDSDATAIAALSGGDSPGGGGVSSAAWASESDSGVLSPAKCFTMGSSAMGFLEGMVLCGGEGVATAPKSVPRATLTFEGGGGTATGGTVGAAEALTLLSRSCKVEGRVHSGGPDETCTGAGTPLLRKDSSVSVGRELSKKGMPEASPALRSEAAAAPTPGGDATFVIAIWIACNR